MVDTQSALWIGNLAIYNDGEICGDWLSLPIYDEQEFKKFLESKCRIGECDEYGQEYEEWYIGDITSNLPIEYHEYMSIEEILELSTIISDIENFNDSEFSALLAWIEHNNNNLEEAYHCISGGNYAHYPNIKSWYDLGEFYFNNGGYDDEVSERMRDFIDFEKFGKRMGEGGNISNEHGYFESW